MESTGSTLHTGNANGASDSDSDAHPHVGADTETDTKTDAETDRLHVLVTGGAGYIGSALVPLLLDAGFRVTVYDKLVHGVGPLLHLAHRAELTVTRGDILDERALGAAMRPADAVVHLAAVVGFPACSARPAEARMVNVEGTRAVTRLLRSGQRLVYASTGSCYGAVPDGECTEQTPINPLTLYGETKAQAESIVLAAGGSALRLATVFGVSARLRLDLLVNNLSLIALRRRNIDLYEGDVKRTFLHVRDAAAAFVFALRNYDAMKGQAFNVGDERMNMSKRDVAARIVAQVKGSCITASVGEDLDKRDYRVSYKKIRDLGYVSTVSMETGIAKLLRVLPNLSDSEIKVASNV